MARSSHTFSKCMYSSKLNQLIVTFAIRRLDEEEGSTVTTIANCMEIGAKHICNPRLWKPVQVYLVRVHIFVLMCVFIVLPVPLLSLWFLGFQSCMRLRAWVHGTASRFI